jgi:hypothetical protein
VPFTYGMGRRFTDGRLVEVRRNLAKVRAPKAHTRIKYLEREFVELFVLALEGLLPDGSPDPAFRGLYPGRNAAMARFVLSSAAALMELIHNFLTNAGPVLHADLGQFLMARQTALSVDPMIEAALLLNELAEAADLVQALADQSAAPPETKRSTGGAVPPHYPKEQ